MSDDPRIDKLSTAFATLIVAIIDIAKGSNEAAEERPMPPRAARSAKAKPDTPASAEPAADASPDPKDSSQQTATTSSEAGAVVGDPELFEKVKVLTKDVSKSKGRDAAVELLSTFGAERATQLKPEQWPEFIEAAEAILEDDLT